MSESELVVETSVEEETCTLRLAGELDPSTAPSLEGEVRGALSSAGCTRLILDLDEVTFIDSSGLAVLLLGLKMMRDREGVLVVRHPSPVVQRLLDITALTDELMIE